MTSAQLEVLMRNILRHPQLPFTFHSLSASADAWHIVVHDQAGAPLSMTVPAGRPLEVRRAIEARLEATVEDGAAHS